MRVRALRTMAATALASSALVLACNLGEEFPIAAPGFGGTPGFFDAGSPPERRGRCDVREGDTCTSIEVDTCETKEHANPTCNGVLSCESYTWRARPAERGSCASDCPSQYVADLPDGCAVPNAGTLICEYPEGTCGCAPIRPVEPDAGDGGGGDAGDGTENGDDAGKADGGDAGPTVYAWRCITPEAGCPRTRPSIGSDCVRPMTCDYGDCLFEDGVTMRCYSGSWVSEKRCDR